MKKSISCCEAKKRKSIRTKMNKTYLTLHYEYAGLSD